ncbi:hypothetical protein [Mucilaginibacter pedocola]|uniref:Fibronectin type-III domain-containing protein n=1 Tax=Mucilaginibacter pedocola TaxID=1792845 RepID=A0A1S9PBK7_9SPHI|nr:hypothetical protein [Mucilaginibacter pedocola]OOQ58335.1 hypothetical protein BC343_11925 [Mucilaginibacter pedocola]
MEKKTVTPLAPGEGYQSTSYTVNFWWDEVEDATQYRLQVVTPGFDTVGALMADTLVKGNKFAFSLSPGRYAWRVRAENNSSFSGFSAAKSFTVVASSIKQQKVILTAPANNALTNQDAATFRWTELYGATKYQLQVDSNNFANEASVVYDISIPATQYTFFFPRDRQYQWRVRAANDTAQALWSEVRVINYDHTPPGLVTLVSPAEGQSLPLPVNLQWNNVLGATRYRVYVYKADGTTLFNTSFPVAVTTNSYSFNLGVPGDKIYWKVSALDAAGNEGTASALRSFTIQ